MPDTAHLIRIGKTKEIHAAPPERAIHGAGGRAGASVLGGDRMSPIAEGTAWPPAAAPPGHLVIRYRDTVLGTNGVIDPGANEVLLEIPEKGRKTCDAAVAFFKQCRDADVPTHFVRRLDALSILVRAAQRFPVEVVLRNFAYGSYLRRHPGTPPLAPLAGLIEFFVKDDAAGDPLIDRDEAVAAGLMPAAMVAPVIEWTRRVAALLGRDHEVVDFKVEFGIVDGALTLIDEVSADSLRLRVEGNVLDYPATLERLADAAAERKPVLSP